MRAIFRLIVVLVVLGGIGVVGYAYLGDLSPATEDVVDPIMLDAN